MYAHARCRRRGIRCESGTVPQRCTCMSAPRRSCACQSEDLSTARPATRPGCHDVRASRNGPVDATPRARRVPPLPPALPAGPRAERGRAPRDHRASRPGSQRKRPSTEFQDRAEADGPGTALLRTLTELTADLPDADPGRVAAAALRGRSAVGPTRRGAARAGHRGGRRPHLRGPRLLAARRPPADDQHRARRPPRRASRPSPSRSRSATARASSPTAPPSSCGPTPPASTR